MKENYRGRGRGEGVNERVVMEGIILKRVMDMYIYIHTYEMKEQTGV